jgi:2-polyprenyl-3-methyl-5-hydroxy-6-metoxy-1,4-benzoquinol methylase
MPLWPDLRRRRVTPEVMDRPDLDPAAHAHALRGLARINGLSGTAGTFWPAVRDLARAAGPAGIRVLDVATGGGDVPLRLWHTARRAGVRVHLAGCDRSPLAIDVARGRAAAAGADIAFFALDVFADPLPTDYDVLTCSLFLHHLNGAQPVDLLRRMAVAARRLVLVNDLARGPLGYALAYLCSRVLTRSPVVHVDGPLSVRAAFTPTEAAALAREAGLAGATVARWWPCRFLLAWAKPAGEAADGPL